MMFVARYYMQTLPSVNNPPTWMVCPLHTCEACPQAPNLLSSFSHRFEDGRRCESSSLYPKYAKRPFQKFEVNLVPLSQIIALRNPCNMKIPFMKIFAMALNLYVELTGIKCDALLTCPPQP